MIEKEVFLETINSQKELIDELAKRAKFTKSDIKIILDNFVIILEDLIKESHFENGKNKKLLLKYRGFGQLYIAKIPKRKGRNGEILPETTRPIFKLSENIKYANKEIVDVDKNLII